ncbi:hypothetical protein [Streptococcus sanguinis]|uniref:Uncharacterized protein n=1 Tax=Streptococcus sanguinis SK115 TaxID=888810 RepID=F0IBH1_STRSA|nr:hypothetical protein [Streptococcus sanguinis]EGD31025.1 hypothetical protein HMPREF9382_2109 [Streptococcus sanguinis SK115]MBF1698373.1 hypothetical protein [Streptococcus cristatus]MBZ2053354.1 hypothetical protein [Streptococcus sanguinis]
MSKKKGTRKRKSSTAKYIFVSGALILASTVLLPKVLKKTTNYLYKKQVKITNHRKVNFDCKDKLVKKSEYKKVEDHAN